MSVDTKPIVEAMVECRLGRLRKDFGHMLGASFQREVEVFAKLRAIDVENCAADEEKGYVQVQNVHVAAQASIHSNPRTLMSHVNAAHIHQLVTSSSSRAIARRLLLIFAATSANTPMLTIETASTRPY